MKQRIKRTTRQIGEPEPNGADVLFALCLILMAITMVVFLVGDVATALQRFACCTYHG